MKTIILCGGQGTRMREETEFKPKPLVLIGDKPILWHIMKIYSRYSFNDFILALGYKGEMIKQYFLNWRSLTNDFTLNVKNREIAFHNDDCDDFKITFADTGLNTAHGERVLKLKNHIPDDMFMVTYGDGVAKIDISELVNFHKKKGVIATITGVHPTSRWGIVNIDQNDLVKNFNQKPDYNGYVNGGFMVFNKDFFDYIKPGDMIEDALLRLIPQKQLAMYRHDDFWFAIDTYREMLMLNELWEKNPQWKIWTN